MANQSAGAVCCHSGTGTAFPVDQRLGVVHDLLVRERRAGVGQGLLNLGAEPGVLPG